MTLKARAATNWSILVVTWDIGCSKNYENTSFCPEQSIIQKKSTVTGVLHEVQNIALLTSKTQLVHPSTSNAAAAIHPGNAAVCTAP